jgi:hypothetical protein
MGTTNTFITESPAPEPGARELARQAEMARALN